ncbi:MAG: C10 family peptidase [Muribaculaceae bacterium]|nr:C10 family peptidase [Muribaculaceae bacterium]
MKISTILKSISAAVLVLSPMANASARQLSPEEALRRAISNPAKGMRMPRTNQLSLSYTETLEGSDLVYVFNDYHKGFLLIAGDDNMQPLLGYSEQGSFDYDSASPALRWWISQYASEAFAVTSINVTPLQADGQKTTEDKKPIPYMIQTKWGQQYPFNIDCPEINGKKCVTGCVATAMAQIVKYHGYPEAGNDTHRYDWHDTFLEFNYGATEFNYADMLESYSSASTPDQCQAVATLMNACGIAVNMQYSQEQSSASDIYISYALRHFFNYDNETRFLKREFFSDRDWEDLIYSELVEGRPVIYGGQAPKGGHQFICDGYEGNGFFHINWGWEGLGDGYFRLSSLQPDIQGTGGFEGGYNSDQSAICGIQPAKPDSKIWFPIYSTGSLEVTEISYGAVDLCIEGGGLFNYSQEATDAQISLLTISKDGKEYISVPQPFMTPDASVPTTYLPFRGAIGTSISGYSIFPTINLPEYLPAGEYKCTIVIKTSQGNIQKVYFPQTAVSYFNLYVDDSGNVSITPGQPEAKAEIRVSRFEPQTDVISGDPTKFYITVENIGDVAYSGWIEYRIYKDGQQIDDVTRRFTFNSIAPEAAPTYILDISLPLEAGIYDFIFFNQYGEQISDPFAISVGDSGVEEIMNIHQSVDVFSAAGSLLKKNADHEYVRSLSKGIFILSVGGKSYKVIR